MINRINCDLHPISYLLEHFNHVGSEKQVKLIITSKEEYIINVFIVALSFQR